MELFKFLEKAIALLTDRCYRNERVERKMDFGQRVKKMWKNFYELDNEKDEE
jgi:hypothetical protein